MCEKCRFASQNPYSPHGKSGPVWDCLDNPSNLIYHQRIGENQPATKKRIDTGKGIKKRPFWKFKK